MDFNGHTIGIGIAQETFETTRRSVIPGVGTATEHHHLLANPDETSPVTALLVSINNRVHGLCDMGIIVRTIGNIESLYPHLDSKKVFIKHDLYRRFIADEDPSRDSIAFFLDEYKDNIPDSPGLPDREDIRNALQTNLESLDLPVDATTGAITILDLSCLSEQAIFSRTPLGKAAAAEIGPFFDDMLSRKAFSENLQINRTLCNLARNFIEEHYLGGVLKNSRRMRLIVHNRAPEDDGMPPTPS